MRLAPIDKCTACMACVDSCRHKALSVSVDSNGFFKINFNEKNCVECGACRRICTVINKADINKDSITLSKPFAAWCTDGPLRAKSASGGAFAAIAKAFLGKGAIVYGAAIDGLGVSHRRVDKIEDLPLLLGSKYQHSKMEGVFVQIRKDLTEGRIVLFCGLSCQTVAVMNYVGEKLKDKLYTIDTICGGVSTMLPIIQISKRNGFSGILSFRNKDDGWKSVGYQYDLKMISHDGNTVDLGADNLILRCFRNKFTKRASCLDCQFNGFHRPSDATIGDFWGDTRFREQHEQGLSVLVVHSQRLNDVIQNSSLHIEPISWQELVKFNPNVYWSHHPYILNTYTRKRIFRKLCAGNEDSVVRIFEGSLIKRLEDRIFHSRNEQKRKTYLKQVLESNR